MEGGPKPQIFRGDHLRMVPINDTERPAATRSDPATPVAGKRATLRCETGSSNPSAVVHWRHMGKRMRRQAAHTTVKVREGMGQCRVKIVIICMKLRLSAKLYADKGCVERVPRLYPNVVKQPFQRFPKLYRDRLPGLVNFVPAVAYYFCLARPCSIYATWCPPFSRALYILPA